MKKLKSKIWLFIPLISAVLFFSGFLIFGLSGLTLVWAATGCTNGAGGTFSYNIDDPSSEIARKACESKYGAGNCAAGSCAFFDYWYRTAGGSCYCVKPVDEYEWIYNNRGFTGVGQDYGGQPTDVTGDSLFVRRKNTAVCDANSWVLTLKYLGDPSTCSAGGGYRGWLPCEYGSLNINVAPTSGYALGYQFTPNRNGQITKLCGYFNAIKMVRLYDKDHVMRAFTSVTSSNNWVCNTISPVSVSAGLAYHVVVEWPINAPGLAWRSLDPALLNRTCGDITIDYVVWQLSPSGSGTEFDGSHQKGDATTGKELDGLVDVEMSFETADTGSSFLLFE